MTPDEFTTYLEEQIVEGIRNQKKSLGALAGLLRGIKIDIKITPSCQVRAVIIQTECEYKQNGSLGQGKNSS